MHPSVSGTPSNLDRLVFEWDDSDTLYHWSRPLKVFLAEDDPDLRELLSDTLRAEGYNVSAAADGETLGDLIAADPTFLLANDSTMVVSDVRLPGKSGIDLLRHLRNSGWRTPVLLMTAFGSRELSEEASRLGVSMVLNKPFSEAVFIEVVRLLCGKDSRS